MFPVGRLRECRKLENTYCLAVAALLLLPLTAAAQGTVRIVQTNSAGDNVHIIDPVTNRVVGQIPDIEISNGIDFNF